MKEKGLKKNDAGLFVLLAVFFFIRTALLAPVHCFLMKSDYPYFRFSAGGAFYVIFAVVLSAVSAKLAFTIRDKIGEAGAFVYIIAMADPLFFGTKHDALKLIADIVIELMILNAISDKRIASNDIAFPFALFVSTFLVPFSIIGYAPVMLGIYILIGRKTKKEKHCVKIVLIAIACAGSGFLLNKILMSEVQAFNEWYTAFTFADITDITKRPRLVLSLLPVAVFGTLFFRLYKKTTTALVKKKADKKDSFETVLDAFFLPAVISAGAMFFTHAEGFCAINIIVPAIILTLLCLKDEACIKTVEQLIGYIKKYKVISLVAFLLVFVLALKGADDYYPARQLLFYLIY